MSEKTLTDVRVLPTAELGQYVLTIEAGEKRATYRLTPNTLRLLAFEVIEAMGLPGAIPD